MTIVLPCFNEASHIEDVIGSVKPEVGDRVYEILVLDGGSTDGTRAIVERLARADGRIRLIANEKRLQSAGVNKGASLADPRSSVLLRVDCHAGYPRDFVPRLVTELRRTGASSVVVPMRAVGSTCVQRGIAAVQNSKLGTGGSPHRSKATSRYIDHGHHAAFDLQAFRSVGGYDETFSHNEDAEYDHRLVRSGRRIWMCADLPISYYPRRTLARLARQYVNHGKGRGRTIFKHAIWPKPRQLAPVVILAVVAVSLVLAAVLDLRWIAPALAYAAVCCTGGALLAVRERDRCVLLAGPAAMIMHLGWAVGFLKSAAAAVLDRTQRPEPRAFGND